MNVSTDKPPVTIVGIGASAGGLDALERLFEHLDTLPHAALVIVQHLSPDHRSMMSEILGRRTRMPIQIIEDGMLVEAGHLYLNKPRCSIRVKDDFFQVDEAQNEPMHVPRQIDALLESLAKRSIPHSVGVVLSGTGTDGAHGLRMLAERGALTIVQDPEDAKFDGMPRAALATASRSLVVRADQLGELLYAHTAEEPGLGVTLMHNINTSRILELLQDKYKIDFEPYKQTTISRRIARRLTLSDLDNIDEYVMLLRRDPEELETLFHDLLIGVTEFFRDAEAFELLEQQILNELHTTSESDTVRVWVAGCATGEEVYSVAILLDEYISSHDTLTSFTIFATDVHPGSLKTAGLGVYQSTQLKSVSRERLSRYFEPVPGDAYQISRRLRQRVIFAPHNLMSDPPFTRIDLICCRNVLIYFNSEAQKQAFQRFHHALSEHGLLFLGPSESLGNMEREFEELDARWKFYRKLRNVRLSLDTLWPSKQNFLPPSWRPSPNHAPIAPRAMGRPASQLSEMFVQNAYDGLLGKLGLSGFLVDETYGVVHLFGDAASYMQISQGRMATSLLDMLGPELRQVVKAALGRVQQTKQRIQTGVSITSQSEPLELEVEPITQHGTTCYLVSLNHPTAERKTESFRYDNVMPSSNEQNDHIDDLELTVGQLRQHIQLITEQGDAHQEELQATNEELQAANEELQAANEELQSTNEELHTVNDEYQSKLEELHALNMDFDRLISTFELTTVFLDNELNIRRYYDINDLLHLLPQDVGRPLGHLRASKMWETMFEDIEQVNATQQGWETILHDETAEREQWYLCRVMPHHENSEGASGLMVAIIGISEQQRLYEAVKENEERLRRIMDTVVDGYWDWSLHPDGTLAEGQYMSPGFMARFGHDPEHATLEQWADIVFEDDLAVSHEHLEKHIATNGEHPYTQTLRCMHADGSTVTLYNRGIALKDAHGQWERLVGVNYDITSLKLVEMQVRQANEALEQYANIVSHDFKQPVRVITTYSEVLQQHLKDNDLLDSSASQYLDFIVSNSVRLASMIQDVLNLSRIGYSTSRKSFAQVDMNEVVELAITGLKLLVDERDVQWRIDKLPHVFGDATMLTQVMQNLIHNAIRYTPAEEAPQIAIWSRHDHDEWTLCVEDQGIGIPKEAHQRIFAPFQRLDRHKDTLSDQGSGIGLATVRRIIQYHHGTVWVESDKEKGSSFFFTVPIHQ